MTGSWRLRGYVVEQRLGGGASSSVWRARVAATGEPVALKRIELSARSAVEQRRRAQHEAALLGALDHAHLVRLHALIPADDAMVLVLDLAGGGSLAELLRSRGRLTPGEVITAVAPVAAALAYLHDEGVVHGDVSPANIVFTAGGSPLLTDVGVARLTGDDRDAASTPAYVDPSVARGCVPGPQSDVFMLAAVALHALSGTPAWPAADADAALGQAARGDLGDVAARLADARVPPAMIGVLTKALALDPQRRGTAADLALDLRHSGEPAAVDLLAGRWRAGDGSVASGPRHAAPPARPAAAAARAAAAQRRPRWRRAGAAPVGRPGPDVAAAGRPAFERPGAPIDGAAGSTAAGRPAAPPTRLVGPRPRPAVPARRRVALPPGRPVLVLLVVLAGVLVAAAGTVWAATRPGPGHVETYRPVAGSGSSAAPLYPPSSTRVATHGLGSARPRGRGPARAGTGSPRAVPAAVAALRTLAALDRLRATAYASRDPALLDRVYASPALLRADAERLRRTVPAGCGLIGARTAYSGARAVSVRDTRTALTVRATLATSTLTCAGRTRAVAAGAGPVVLRVELIRSAAGPRISAQRAG